MCPDSILLVAYLDGTLHRRDAADVEQHVETCVRCSTLLDDMRRARGYGRRSRWSSPMMIASAAALAAILALGSWIGMTRSRSAPPAATMTSTPTETGNRTDAPPTTPAKPVAAPPALEAASPKPAAAPAVAASVRATQAPQSVNERVTSQSSSRRDASRRPARTETASRPGRIEGSIVLRGRRTTRNIIWRVRDRVVEHSVDGGATWMEEHTSDRAIRVGAFVDANVAWLAGDQGLVLRRTRNGWFSASPPADAAITAMNASSPSKASVTLDDGRVFATENGGVSWSEAARNK
jgi:Putative zinc-finger